jgi:uncharacterized membrane protein YhaH (DUF805 family)
MSSFSFTIFVLLIMSAGIPSIAATIAYAAWKGKPKTFDREMYWTSFAAAGIASALVFVLAQKLDSKVSAGHLVPAACLLLALLLLGVSMGCAIAIFTWRRPDSWANE